MCAGHVHGPVQEALARLEDGGHLHALRVVVATDVVARLPPRLPLGCVHGARARLTLHPADSYQPLALTCDDPDDWQLWRLAPKLTHSHHALYLGGETTYRSWLTVPEDAAWPIAAAMRDARIQARMAAELERRAARTRLWPAGASAARVEQEAPPAAPGAETAATTTAAALETPLLIAAALAVAAGAVAVTRGGAPSGM